MTTKVIDRDLGWSRIMGTLHKMTGNKDLYVGIQGPEAAAVVHDGPVTNVMLAVVHEFGATVSNAFGKGIVAVIPERSFLRSNFDENNTTYARLLETGLGRVVDGKMSALQLMAQVGEKAVSDVKQRIASAKVKQDLKPATVAARKRRGNPPGPALQETQQLRDSVTWVIR